MKLLWSQPTYAGMVKESFSNRVTIKTSINGNQPCIYMKGKLQEGSKCRVPKAEMSLVRLRIRKNISLIGMIWMGDWKEEDREWVRVRSYGALQTKDGVWIFFFFKFLVQPLVNRAKDWHDNYAFKIHFEGNQVENISTRKWEGRKKRILLRVRKIQW